MQTVQYKPIYGRNFVKENIRKLRIMQFRLQEENASRDSEVRTFTPGRSRSKPQRCVRRNSKISAPKKKALVASLQGILKKPHSASGKKYLQRCQRSYQEDHQKAVLNNSLQYVDPRNIRKKKLHASLRKKHLTKRKLTKAKTGQLSEDVSLLHNKLTNVPAMVSLQSNAQNTVLSTSSNMFAHKALQLKSSRENKVLQRKLKSLTKFWHNGADNITKSDATDSDENHIMANDHKSSASQNTTLTSFTFDATAKDTLRGTTGDPGTTDIVKLCNKSVTTETENENCSSIANETSANCLKRKIDVVNKEQKPSDAPSQQVLNVSCSNPKEDISRELSSEEQHDFGQQLTELDYHLGYVPPLALKRKKAFNSFNKAQTSRRNFIKENIKHLRKMQIHLNEKRSHSTPATLLQSTDQKAASKLLSQFPISQNSQKHSNRGNKTSRRKMKNKITHQQKTFLCKVPKLNLQISGEEESMDLDQISSRTSLSSVHDSGCSTASDETFRNFTAETNNDKEMYHMGSSDDQENILSPEGHEALNSIKNYSDAKVMKQTVLAPDSQGTLNASSPRQRKAESLNVKMTAKAMAARQKVLAPSPPNPLKPPPSYQKGVLPKYLQSRQEEQQKEECVRQLRDPDCPPGYVRLPDIERRETLSILRKYYGDLIQGMNMLPVQATAKKIQQKKMDIEKQLEKLQAAIKVFSKPKVYMKVGS